MLLLALPIGFGIAGLLVGRWWVVIAAMAGWAILAAFLYFNNGWYGNGWGEFGVMFNVLAAAATIIAAAGGVAVRQTATRSSRGTAARAL
jgi:hypothetical protein